MFLNITHTKNSSLLRAKRAVYLLPALLSFTAISGLPIMSEAQAQQSLIITSGPLSQNAMDAIQDSFKDTVYARPVEVREITASEVIRDVRPVERSSAVSSRVDTLQGELGSLQSRASMLAGEIESLNQNNDMRSAEYYANIASINTQLQSGTTPGNPRLVSKLSDAEQHLEYLNGSLGQMNGLSLEVSETASQASHLLESTRAAFGLSGAVEEDHVQLAELEDSVHGTIIMIDRILNGVNDQITRTSTHIASERQNLRTLALGVTNGELYGRGLSAHPFSNVASFDGGTMQATPAAYTAVPVETVDSAALTSGGATQASVSSRPAGQRILAKIKFDRPDVEYEQPVYLAVSQALERYPDARFDLVAVNPTSGNAAEVAIETTKARRNAEKVLRTLTSQGLPMDKIDLSYSESAEATSSEVHLFVK